MRRLAEYIAEYIKNELSLVDDTILDAKMIEKAIEAYESTEGVTVNVE